MLVLYNYSIVAQDRQSILQKFEEKMKYKEKISPYIIKMYQNLYDDNFLIETKSKNKTENFLECSKQIWLDKDTGAIVGARFCKQRLCPICNYRRSTMLWHKVKEVTNHIDNEYIFITLTVKNCPAENLKKEIDHILESFHRITTRRTWKKNFIGYIRGLEITYNAKENTYHPHLHILAVACEDYFKSEYVDIHTLRQWWTESAQLDYYVQVNIKKVKDKDSAIAEVVKYAVKVADLLENEIDENRLKATQTIASCINGRRLMSTGGIITKLSKKLKIDLEAEEEEMNDIKNAYYYEFINGKYEYKNLQT